MRIAEKMIIFEGYICYVSCLAFAPVQNLLDAKIAHVALYFVHMKVEQIASDNGEWRVVI